MNKNVPNWTGIVFDDDDSVKKLEKLYSNHKQKTMKHWFVAADHVSICVGNGPSWLNREHYVARKFKVYAYEIGWHDTAIAVKVKFDKKFETAAAFPHSTLAYDIKYGKGGFTSNQITLWNKIPIIELSGTVKEGTSSFKNKR